MRNNRKDRKWLRNPDQRKTTKLFNVNLIQRKDGSFQLIGKGSKVLMRKNSSKADWVNVNIRDLCSELKSNKIHTL